jgi:hypothetical protein
VPAHSARSLNCVAFGGEPSGDSEYRDALGHQLGPESIKTRELAAHDFSGACIHCARFGLRQQSDVDEHWIVDAMTDLADHDALGVVDVSHLATNRTGDPRADVR